MLLAALIFIIIIKTTYCQWQITPLSHYAAVANITLSLNNAL